LKKAGKAMFSGTYKLPCQIAKIFLTNYRFPLDIKSMLRIKYSCVVEKGDISHSGGAMWCIRAKRISKHKKSSF